MGSEMCIRDRLHPNVDRPNIAPLVPKIKYARYRAYFVPGVPGFIKKDYVDNFSRIMPYLSSPEKFQIWLAAAPPEPRSPPDPNIEDIPNPMTLNTTDPKIEDTQPDKTRR